MVKVNGVTLIERMLKQLDKLNLSKVVIVVGYEGKKLINYIGGLKMVANTTPVIDTTAVIPMTAGLEFDHLRTKLPDSTWMVAGKTVLKGGIKASSTDKRYRNENVSLDEIIKSNFQDRRKSYE